MRKIRHSENSKKEKEKKWKSKCEKKKNRLNKDKGKLKQRMLERGRKLLRDNAENRNKGSRMIENEWNNSQKTLTLTQDKLSNLN